MSECYKRYRDRANRRIGDVAAVGTMRAQATNRLALLIEWRLINESLIAVADALVIEEMPS